MTEPLDFLARKALIQRERQERQADLEAIDKLLDRMPAAIVEQMFEVFTGDDEEAIARLTADIRMWVASLGLED
jgi:hypothetical protein